MNSSVPSTTVITSASTGDATLQKRDGSGRGSSLNIVLPLHFLPLPLGKGRGEGTRRLLAQRMHHPQPAHPLADLRHRRPRAVHARRQPPLGDHLPPVADLEQL